MPNKNENHKLGDKILARNFLEKLSNQQNGKANALTEVYCKKAKQFVIKRHLEGLKCWMCVEYYFRGGSCEPLSELDD